MRTIRVLALSLALIALLAARRPCGEEPPSGCTVFTVAKGARAFFAGNDD